MMNYIGIGVVIIVTGLVVALTAGVGTSNVLKAIEEYKVRQAQRTAKAMKERGDTISGIVADTFSKIDDVINSKTNKTVDYSKYFEDDKKNDDGAIDPIKE